MLHRRLPDRGDAARAHSASARAARRARAVELLDRRSASPSPSERLKSFPHQMSGGQCQRVMIAMAIACNPKLLIADEPTTALDVTIQKQILDLLLRLQAEHGMALVLITHDMGVVAETADRVIVQYNGRKMEEADVLSLFESPKSAYTRALLSALPENATGDRLPTVSDFAARRRGAGNDRRAGPRDPRHHPRLSSAAACSAARARVHARQGRRLHGRAGQDAGRSSASRGCGKSTLARIITHDRRADRGRAADRGREGRHRPRRRLAASCAARCRSSSRTPTARSTRARRSATCWPSR